jgi:hypothetical protein
MPFDNVVVVSAWVTSEVPRRSGTWQVGLVCHLVAHKPRLSGSSYLPLSLLHLSGPGASVARPAGGTEIPRPTRPGGCSISDSDW